MQITQAGELEGGRPTYLHSVRADPAGLRTRGHTQAWATQICFSSAQRQPSHPDPQDLSSPGLDWYRAQRPSFAGKQPHNVPLALRLHQRRDRLAGYCCSQSSCGLCIDAALPFPLQLTFSRREMRVCLQQHTTAVKCDPSTYGGLAARCRRESAEFTLNHHL